MTNLALELIQSPLVAFSVIALLAAAGIAEVQDRKGRRK